jgi:hypothetical protein
VCWIANKLKLPKYQHLKEKELLENIASRLINERESL